LGGKEGGLRALKGKGKEKGFKGRALIFWAKGGNTPGIYLFPLRKTLGPIWVISGGSKKERGGCLGEGYKFPKKKGGGLLEREGPGGGFKLILFP